MKHRAVSAGFIIVLMMLMTLGPVFANAGPIVIEESPALSILPVGDSEIRIEAERLLIDISQGSSNTAHVRAVYQMVNPTERVISQTMLFPFVSEPHQAHHETMRILANEEAVEVEMLRLLDLSRSHHSVNEVHWSKRAYEEIRDLDWETLTAAAGEWSKAPRHIHLDEEVTRYRFDFPVQDEEYQASISFLHQEKSQMILAEGFNALANDGEGKLTWSRWIRQRPGSQPANTALVTVAGKSQTLNQLTFPEGTLIEQETMTLESALMESVDKADISSDRKSAQFVKQYTINQLDHLAGQSQRVINLDWDILHSYSGTPFVGALLYTVTFEPESQVNLDIQYELMIGQDRSDTVRYSSLVAYFLSPAAEWSHFQNLTIEVIPHEDQPYLMDSTLPLDFNPDTGNYHNTFEQLPGEELLFRMYHRSKPETGLIKTLSNPYMLLLIIPVALVLAVLGVVALVVILALKKNKMNLRE